MDRVQLQARVGHVRAQLLQAQLLGARVGHPHQLLPHVLQGAQVAHRPVARCLHVRRHGRRRRRRGWRRRGRQSHRGDHDGPGGLLHRVSAQAVGVRALAGRLRHAHRLLCAQGAAGHIQAREGDRAQARVPGHVDSGAAERRRSAQPLGQDRAQHALLSGHVLGQVRQEEGQDQVRQPVRHQSAVQAARHQRRRRQVHEQLVCLVVLVGRRRRRWRGRGGRAQLARQVARARLELPDLEMGRHIYRQRECFLVLAFYK